MAHIQVSRRSMDMATWAKVNFDQLNQFVVKISVPINEWLIRSGEYFPDGYQWDDEDFAPITEGERWGGPDVTSVFKTKFTIPKELDGQKIYLSMLTATEVMVKVNGTYINGLDPNRSVCVIAESAKQNDVYDIILEAYTRSKPDDDRNTVTNSMKGCIQTFQYPQLVVIDEEMLQVKYDLDTLYAMAYDEAVDESVRSLMANHVNEILKILPHYESSREDFVAAIPAVKKYFAEKVYNQFNTYGKQGSLALVAHSHLDIAYHWTAKQTVQKNARTALIQLRLMDKYPFFTYAHSQAWCYEILEEYYPDIFEQVKQRIAEGRWEIVGAMYVEPDCNLISAESHIRQIVYGKKYFQEKFNVDVNNCWLPDVFGNSAIMPQILKKSGVDYFVSNKMSTWNDTNMFPYNIFIWKGLDGSEVNACVPPNHFITWAEPNQAIDNWEVYKEKDIYPESLHMYGYGDGGSGVVDSMVEYIQRQEMLPGVPHQRFTTGSEYLESAFADTKEKLPVWDGDLYLEMHRGTFTTKGDLKRCNRKGEFLAQEVETLSTISFLNKGVQWQQQLEATWKKLLINQFHDILPGSHTTPVATEALALYDEMFSEFNDIKKNALATLLADGAEDDYVVVNPFVHSRHGIAYLQGSAAQNAKLLRDQKGNAYPIQKQVSPNGDTRACTYVPDVDGFSFLELKSAQEDMAFPSTMRITKSSLENQFYSIQIDAAGRITSVYDKKYNREIVKEGSTFNEWCMFDDRPGKYNAWDILDNYKNYPVAISDWTNIEIVEDGTISVALRLEREFSDSKACQIIRLYENSPRIDFETWVDWKEDQKLLRVLFPVDIQSKLYNVDTSAGVVERYNNTNTTWEQAKFEVPCHKWVGVQDGLYGVSVLNDSKYGCSVDGDVIGLSLLRAPIRPDRDSDRKQHYFTYSFMSHSSQWQKDSLVEEAYELNAPLEAIDGKKLDSSVNAPLKIDANALQCQALKLSEDATNNVIIRLVEVYNSKGTATIDFNFPVEEAFICKMTEEIQTPVVIENGRIHIPYKPNEIITLRVKPQKNT